MSLDESAACLYREDPVRASNLICGFPECEVVELAKTVGGENSHRYGNGVVARLSRANRDSREGADRRTTGQANSACVIMPGWL